MYYLKSHETKKDKFNSSDLHFSPLVLTNINICDGRAVGKQELPYIIDRKVWDKMGGTLWRPMWPNLYIFLFQEFHF